MLQRRTLNYRLLKVSATAVLEASDYTIFDAKITQPFLKYFEAYMAVRNIFDKNYEPEVGYPAPGRSYWAGLSVKF